MTILDEKYGILWTRKYRPKTISEMVMDENRKTLVEGWIRDKEIPHLMFCSKSPGTGKSSLANIIIDTIIGSRMDYLILNGSQKKSRGIQIIDEIEQFISVVPIASKIKIVHFEECDRLTPEAQDALKALMEKYEPSARFLFTTNDENGIIDPIRSRCIVMEFKNVPKTKCKEKIQEVFKTEKISMTDTDKENALKLIDIYYPDIRSMLNVFQSLTLEKDGKRILDFEKLSQTKFCEPIIIEEISRLFSFIKSKSYKEASESKRKVEQMIYDNSVNFLILARALFNTFDKIKHQIVIGNFLNSLPKLVDENIGFLCALYEILEDMKKTK